MRDNSPMDRGLMEIVARGEYVVNPHAVAEAMIARERNLLAALRLGVLVAPEARDECAVRADEGGSGAVVDAA